MCCSVNLQVCGMPLKADNLTYSWWSLKLCRSLKNWILNEISCAIYNSITWSMRIMGNIEYSEWVNTLSHSSPGCNHSFHSVHEPRDSRWCISSRWACRKGYWVQESNETLPTFYAPNRLWEIRMRITTLFSTKQILYWQERLLPGSAVGPWEGHTARKALPPYTWSHERSS